MNITRKSYVIEDLLTRMTGISRQEASDQHICVMCKGPAVDFKDELSKREYSISCMCQKCQDSVFG